MDVKPVVSFLVYCANEGRYLQQAVSSMLKQQFIDYEIIILDDGSDDETPQVAYALSLLDSRVLSIRQKQTLGKVASFNHGIQRAQGELLWFFSATDALAAPQTLQDYVTEFLLTPRLAMVFCRVQCMDANGVPYEKYMPHKKNSMLPYQQTFYPSGSLFTPLLRENLMPESGVLVRKRCFERTGLLNAALGRAAFWHLWSLIALDWIIYFDPIPRVYQRLPMSQGDVPLSSALNGDSRLAHYQALETFLTQRDYPKVLTHRTRLVCLHLKRKLGLPLSVPEKLFGLVRFFTLR